MVDDPTPLSWIRGTDEALKLAMNVAEVQRQKADLETAGESVPELIEAFRSMAEAAAVVRPLGWGGRSPSPEVRKSLREAAKTLDNRHVTTALKGLERFRGEAKTDLIGFWHAHITGRLGNVGDLRVLASTLREVGGLDQLSRRLEAVLDDLLKTQQELPSAQSSSLLNEIEIALGELEETLQPQTVRRFLSSVARGGASIGLLTTDVIQWLNEHNALQGFKIVAGSAPELSDD